MERDKILYRPIKNKTDEYTYSINSSGMSSKEHVNTGKVDPGAVTIVFVNQKLHAVEYNFEKNQVSQVKFWFEIQAAVANEIVRLEQTYMEPEG